MSVTAVIGCKGGAGATRLAIRRATAERAVLVDLDLAGGDIDLRLGLSTVAATLVDVAALDPDSLAVDRSWLDAITYRAGDMLVIPSPSQPELAEALSPAHVTALLQVVRLAHPDVVIDLGSRLDAAGLAAAACADEIVLVGTADPGAIRTARALEDVFARAGIPARRTACDTRARVRRSGFAAAAGLPSTSARGSIAAPSRVRWRMRSA